MVFSKQGECQNIGYTLICDDVCEENKKQFRMEMISC